MLAALLTLGALATLIGLLLGYAAIRFRVESDPVVEQIDALLPQTQCGQCTYAGCRPYAEAIAAGEADINQCPPGGEATIQALANLLGKDPKPLNPEHGEHKEKTVVVIDENVCSVDPSFEIRQRLASLQVRSEFLGGTLDRPPAKERGS